MLALLVSGLTAFPIKQEIECLNGWIGTGTFMESLWPPMAQWISTVHHGVLDMSRNHPFIFYGTDWLAFAHVVIAIAFIGPLRDPVRNIWVIEFGMIACVLVIPLALICGPMRGIPDFWRGIDCAFGVVGLVPLYLTRRYIKRLGWLRPVQELTPV